MRQTPTKRNKALWKGAFSSLAGRPRWCESVITAAMSPIDKSPREVSGATRNPRKTFRRTDDGAVPFPFAVTNDTVPHFPFSFSGGDKHGALYSGCGVLSSRQSVFALFFFGGGFRAAELKRLSSCLPPFLPLARQSVSSAGGDTHLRGKWVMSAREAQLPPKCL